MPILDREPSVYPEDLLTELAPLETEIERRWWAVYTKPRQEKSLARDLLAHRVPFFLPLIPKRSVYRGRRIRSHIPMFTGYLFLFGSDDERLRAISTNRISQLLTVHDAEGLVGDLRSIHHLIQSEAPLSVESRLQPGRRVRVSSGPFLGLEGTVEACKSGYRLIVGVKLLQRGVSLEIEDACIEVLS
jgi:transcription antitermination factor NusG